MGGSREAPVLGWGRLWAQIRGRVGSLSLSEGTAQGGGPGRGPAGLRDFSDLPSEWERQPRVCKNQDSRQRQ